MNRSLAEKEMRMARFARWFPALVVIVVSGIWGWLQLDKGWFPHDEGQLGQAAMRILDGELPHRDFDDMYTGGLSFLNALSFRMWGAHSGSMRMMLFCFWIPFLMAIYWLLRQLVTPRIAVPTTLLCAVWSIPMYSAPMPSWYNLFFSTWSLCALVAWCKTRNGFWLVAAGAGIGLSICFKIIGLVGLAAALLLILFDSQARQRRFEKPNAWLRYPLSPSLLLAAGLGLVFVRQDWLMQVIHFALPFAAVVIGALIGEWRDEGGMSRVVESGSRLMWLTKSVTLLLAGVAVPVGLLVAFYGSHGALADLYHGAFVLPGKRLEHASLAFPAWSSTLIAIPLGLALYFSAGQKFEEKVPSVRIVALMVGVALLVGLAAWRPFFELVVLGVRNLGPLMVALNLWILFRNGSNSYRRTILYGATCFAFFASLVQFPFASPVYFFYAASLIVVAIVMASNEFAVCESPFQVGAIGFLVLFSVVHFDSAFPDSSLKSDFVPAATARLETQRSDVLISQKDAEVYGRLQRIVDEVSTFEDRIFAIPDCPQVAFLTGRKAAGRWMYEFFHESWENRGRSTVDSLVEEGVGVIVVSERPPFSGPLPAQFRQHIESRFSLHEVVYDADGGAAFSVYLQDAPND